MSREPVEKREYRPAYVVALCALMAALGAAVMLTSGLIPVLTYSAPLLAGLLLIPVLWEFGRKPAWMTWAVTAALSLLLCADKEAAFFYLFLGCYPIIQRDLDRARSKGARFLLKLLFFALALGVMYGLLLFILRLDALIQEFGAAGTILNIMIYAGLVSVMMIFDKAINGVTVLYQKRLRPKLRFLR